MWEAGGGIFSNLLIDSVQSISLHVLLQSAVIYFSKISIKSSHSIDYLVT